MKIVFMGTPDFAAEALQAMPQILCYVIYWYDDGKHGSSQLFSNR